MPAPRPQASARALPLLVFWLAAGAFLWGFAMLRFAELNPSLRGSDGIVFTLWLLPLYLAFASAPYALQRIAGLIAHREPATRARALAPLPGGVLLALALAGLIVATGAISGAGLRWGLRAVVTLPLAVAVSWLSARHAAPRALQIALALSALLAVIGSSGFALRRIQANQPAVIEGAVAPLQGPRVPLLFIGLDGVDWRKIDALGAAGQIPNLYGLARAGARSPLRSFEPTLSPLIWNSIATGLEPKEHGIQDFSELRLPGMRCGVQRLESDPAWIPQGLGLTALLDLGLRTELLRQIPVSACHRRVKAFWESYSEAGGRIAVLNWFASWPAPAVNGVVVSDANPRRAALLAGGGVDARRSGISYPEQLIAELAGLPLPETFDSDEQVLGTDPFRGVPDAEREKIRASGLLSVYKVIQSADAFSLTAAAHLLRSEEPSLLVVYAAGIDNVSHRFAYLPGFVDRYYASIDRLLGPLLAAAPRGAAIVVVSDHGWEYTGEDFGHGKAPDGIFILNAPGVAPHALSEKPSIYDVAPTVLTLHGLPVGLAMSGQPVWDALPAELSLAARARERWVYGTLSADETLSTAAPELGEETMEKLRALGYVE